MVLNIFSNQPTGGPADAPAHLEPPPPASNDGEEMGAERLVSFIYTSANLSHNRPLTPPLLAPGV